MPPRKPFKFNQSAQNHYQRSLNGLLAEIKKIVGAQILPEQMTYFLNALAQDPKFHQWAIKQSEQMAKNVLRETEKTWRRAAEKSGDSGRIFQALSSDFRRNTAFKQIIENNAKYIITVPQTTAQRLTAIAAKEAIKGLRPEAITKLLQKEAGRVAEYKLKRIARTEVAKAQSTITELRAKNIGVNWYSWQTVNDSRVRKAHDHMQDVLCRFDDPPNPERLAGVDNDAGEYNPGGVYNCRCFAEPIVFIDQVDWPANVYYNGGIKRMSREQFEKIR